MKRAARHLATVGLLLCLMASSASALTPSGDAHGGRAIPSRVLGPAGPTPLNPAGPTPLNPAGPPPLNPTGAAVAFPRRGVTQQPGMLVGVVGDGSADDGGDEAMSGPVEDGGAPVFPVE
jgi:hypothetical protein